MLEGKYSNRKWARDWAAMPNEIRELKQIADRYARFAADEARGSSEIYERLADLAKAAPPASRRGLFLLAVNGSPVAWTGPHGESIDWFGA